MSSQFAYSSAYQVINKGMGGGGALSPLDKTEYLYLYFSEKVIFNLLRNAGYWFLSRTQRKRSHDSDELRRKQMVTDKTQSPSAEWINQQGESLKRRTKTCGRTNNSDEQLVDENNAVQWLVGSFRVWRNTLMVCWVNKPICLCVAQRGV